MRYSITGGLRLTTPVKNTLKSHLVYYSICTDNLKYNLLKILSNKNTNFKVIVPFNSVFNLSQKNKPHIVRWGSKF